MKTVKLLISGQVQGVMFRAFVKHNASAYGLDGYVKNLEDGNVEVVMQGEDRFVDKMTEMCKKGSPFSKVKDVKIEKLPEQEVFGFQIQ